MDNLTTVGSYTQPYEAHIAQQRLRDQGIVAFLRNEHTISIDWFLSNALGGVKVLVPTDRAEEARRILATDASPEFDTVLEDPIACPACGSFDTESFKGRRFHRVVPLVLSAVLLFLMGLMFVILALPFFTNVPKVRCHTCSRTSYVGKWPLKRLGFVTGISTAVLIGVVFLQILFMAWKADFTWEERDWNQDGETSWVEYLDSAFVVKTAKGESGCFAYYQTIRQEKLKENCNEGYNAIIY